MRGWGIWGAINAPPYQSRASDAERRALSALQQEMRDALAERERRQAEHLTEVRRMIALVDWVEA